jgi:hypothetical protein
MALTEEQLNQIEFQKAQQAANNPDRMEAVRLAKTFSWKMTATNLQVNEASLLLI